MAARVPTKNPKATNFAGIKLEIHRRIEEAVNTTAEHAAFLAREAAPVRKIFKGSRRSTRQLSAGELKAESLSRTHLFGKPGKGPISIERERQSFFGGQPRVLPTNPNLRAFGRRRAINALSPQLPGISRAEGQNFREITEIGGKSFLTAGEEVEERLSGRGRYEVRHASERGGVSYGDKQIVGGGLRKSIQVAKLYSRGSVIKQSVTAGNAQVHYAKYVEFGTRHAAGQPFLRPALAKVREEYRSRIARAVNQSLRKGQARTPTSGR